MLILLSAVNGTKAVSYTHLDVYKRQTLMLFTYFSFNILHTIWYTLFASDFSLILCVKVDKRGRPTKKITFFKSNGLHFLNFLNIISNISVLDLLSLIQFINNFFIKEFTNFKKPFSGIIICVFIGVRSVSYTHLDVYKRQVLAPCNTVHLGLLYFIT